jgi:hypothetical protein
MDRPSRNLALAGISYGAMSTQLTASTFHSMRALRRLPLISSFVLLVRLCDSAHFTSSSNRNYHLASGDIRNLVRTVNSLPDDYSGQCDVLLNDFNAIVMNRNAVVLHALLSAGPTLEEAAELAAHLMYSAALPRTSAAYFCRCINSIYGQDVWPGSAHFETRGRGKIYMLQQVENLQLPLKMFLSNYTLTDALERRHAIMLHPSRVDYRDRQLGLLEPGHRMASMHFRKCGILLPFSHDTSHFTEPNRCVQFQLGMIPFKDLFHVISVCSSQPKDNG